MTTDKNSASEQLETLLNLVRIAAAAGNMSPADQEFFQEEGARLLDEMKEQSAVSNTQGN